MRRARSGEDSTMGGDQIVTNSATPQELSFTRAAKRRRVSIMEALQSLHMSGSRAPREADTNQSFIRDDSMGECLVAGDEQSSDCSDIELLSDEQIARRKIMYSLLSMASGQSNHQTRSRKDVVDERLEKMIRETRRQAEQGAPRRFDDWYLGGRRDDIMDVADERRPRSNSLPHQLESVSGRRNDGPSSDIGMDLT